MGRKGGEKKGGGRGAKGQSKASNTTSRAANGPTIKVKSGKALEISQKNAARIRELLQQVRHVTVFANTLLPPA